MTNTSSTPTKMNQLQRVETPKPTGKALTLMASRLNIDPERLKRTLLNTVFKQARGEAPITDEELAAIVIVANEYRLNPLTREIYAFRGQTGGIVPVVGVDGWIKIVNSQESFNGVRFDFTFGENPKIPVSCTCTMSVKNRAQPVEVTEYFDECDRRTKPWVQMPKRMLRHKAYIQCARVAFGLSGIYDEDEAQDIVANVEVSTVPQFEGPEEDQKTTSAALPPPVETPSEDPFQAQGGASEAWEQSQPPPDTSDAPETSKTPSTGDLGLTDTPHRARAR